MYLQNNRPPLIAVIKLQHLIKDDNLQVGALKIYNKAKLFLK